MKKLAGKKPKSIEDKIDDLAMMMSKSFSSFEDRINTRFERIEKILPTLATKNGILDLHDKFIHRREFDQLSLRVTKLEEKARR